MLRKIAGFFTGFTLWLMAVMWIKMASHAIPILAKFEDQNDYQWWAETATKIGKPVWNFAATIFAPIFGGLVTAFGIDWRRGANYLMNSTPQDGAAYIEFVTYTVLFVTLIYVAPALWRMFVYLFERE